MVDDGKRIEFKVKACLLVRRSMFGFGVVGLLGHSTSSCRLPVPLYYLKSLANKVPQDEK